tara:strand:- start:100 stop:462 length:363 start_codon:yes stop_codon:yes gene_type:complete
MPEIIVNINDQDYAIVCDPGEEDHLKNLSSQIDFKVRELTKRFGKIGETRLMVMASLLIADEIHELNKKVDSDLTKITSLEARLESKEKKIQDNQSENKEYLNSKNGELNDLFSKLVSLN